MKTLIISDDDSAVNVINTRLQKSGFDTIIYRWLLKALDNLEEISPDYIIVSVSDYPRHWKTLASFVQANLGRVKAQLILYVPADFSSEEKKKAEALGVKGFFNNLQEKGLSEMEGFLGKKSENVRSGITAGELLSQLEKAADQKPKTGGLLSKIQAMYD